MIKASLLNPTVQKVGFNFSPNKRKNLHKKLKKPLFCKQTNNNTKFTN